MSSLAILPEATDRSAGVGCRLAVIVTKFTAGAGIVALLGAERIDRGRYVPTVFTAAGGSLIADAELAGIEVVRLRHMAPDLDPIDDVRAVRELARLLRERRIDLVHTHSAKAGAIGRLAARAAGVSAVVHTFHGFPFHEFQSRLRRRAYVRAERSLAALTDQFIATGSNVAAAAIRLSIAPPERIRAIENPVTDAPRPSGAVARAEARRLLGIASDAAVVGSVGRLDEQKAPLDLVRAIAGMRRRDVIGVWVGDGTLRRETERLVARYGLSDRFRLLGERRDVARLLPAFDIFAAPSLYEGFPVAVVEAMVAGTPVVASAVNSVPELVIPGSTGVLVPPRDAPTLARVLDYLLERPAEAQRMATEARRGVRARLSIERFAESLQDVYELALGSPRRAEARTLTGGVAR